MLIEFQVEYFSKLRISKVQADYTMKGQGNFYMPPQQDGAAAASPPPPVQTRTSESARLV
jgi:hypothetical protein